MENKEITEKEELKRLFEDNCVYAWQGLDSKPSSVGESDFEHVSICFGSPSKDSCGSLKYDGYIIKGKTMNEICHFTGRNAYPDDLVIFISEPVSTKARWEMDCVEGWLGAATLRDVIIDRAIKVHCPHCRPFKDNWEESVKIKDLDYYVGKKAEDLTDEELLWTILGPKYSRAQAPYKIYRKHHERWSVETVEQSGKDLLETYRYYSQFGSFVFQKSHYWEWQD